MHHLFLALISLTLILLFIFLPWPLALSWSAGILGILLAFFLVVNRKQSAGPAGAPGRTMVGSRATVIKARNNKVEVRWQGEIWHAVSAQPLRPGEEVIIERVEGLTLRVRLSTPEDKQTPPG
jgi:membrane protein implicated in regulation of membrane protease activity